MTTLSGDALRPIELGDVQEYPIIAADIVYAMAAVGLVATSGHARPLVGGDLFVGFAEARADNSGGAAAAKAARVLTRGQVQLAVAGAVITDVGQPVYATDDDTFVFNPVGASFVGFVSRFVSAGIAVVAFDTLRFKDPYGEFTVRETLTGTKTFDAEDAGKAFFVTEAGDGDPLNLPAVAAGFANALIVAIGAFGTTALTISPDAADNVRGPDITPGDNKDLILTKATQRRGDRVYIAGGDADGYVVGPLVGAWTRET